MRKILIFILLISSLSWAQTYQYIGVEDGLSNQQVYAIQKDKEGYMWFLTRYGIDRYDGKEFKSYKLMDGDKEVNSMLSLSWLYMTRDSVLWEIGRKGHVFRYNPWHDQFQLVYQLPDTIFHPYPDPVTFAFIDSHNNAWLCHNKNIYLYNADNNIPLRIANPTGEEITYITQIDDQRYFIGTDEGVYLASYEHNKLNFFPDNQLASVRAQIDALYFDAPSQQLFIGTLLHDMYVYNLEQHQLTKLNTEMKDVSITCIRPFNDHEILIATNSVGIYKMNIRTHQCEPYITADYNSHNGMNGNNIYDVYVDGHRIWISNYPIGITVRNNQNTAYEWIKHAIGNTQSLINDQVNSIIEDSDGDLWYATGNGISYYQSRTHQWKSFLNTPASSTQQKADGSHIFFTVCEVAPNIIWAAGYTSTIYEIDKRTFSITALTPADYQAYNLREDKYIRTITTDSSGMIWAGGYYNLKQLDYRRKRLHLIPGINGITYILERDKESMWIGSANGLYLLNKQSGSYQHIPLPTESFYITSLYQADDSLLYIGTNSSGMLIYHPDKNSFESFHKDNCGLISNSINTILHNNEGKLIISTDKGLTGFHPQRKMFRNWTHEQGLKVEHFNPNSGTICGADDVIFGSTDGAIRFNRSMTLPDKYNIKMVFGDLRIFYRTVYPGEKDSPLATIIDKTETLRLKYSQNIFSIDVFSINYDYPSLPLFSWKLEGFYDQWSHPTAEERIRFTNLSPGNYKLIVRAVSSEDQRIVLTERSMDIIIEKPVWLSIWAILLYIIMVGAVISMTLRYLFMQRQRKISNEKIRFFVNTAHDIRTPLTLIKAPIEEIGEQETLTPVGESNVSTALRNVNALLRLTTNLINFERADIYSNVLYCAEYELSAYMEDTVNSFGTLAEIKHIDLTYTSNFSYLNAWIDKDKMDSILKNILSNALKYTPNGGSVQVTATESDHHWSIEVRDTGIGVPAAEQKRLFRTHFRGSNAINSKVTGSGIGLMLVWKLVHLHRGKLTFSSTEGKGTTVKVTFPKSPKYYRKALRVTRPESEQTTFSAAGVPEGKASTVRGSIKPSIKEGKQLRILLVEDNDDLRNYLLNTLSDSYTVQACENGKIALEFIKKELPDLVISDVMMPEMNGDELCRLLKTNIDTSHIPVILLTALHTEHNIIDGLRTGADEYIVKPFNIGILRATIANLLANRARLRQRYANLEIGDAPEEDCVNCNGDSDRKFIAEVKHHVEEHLSDSSFNVDTLCTLLYMSRTSFYNKIKALTDQAPADYIRFIRLKRAAKLLKEQRHNVTEVAELTGFSDAKYFREVFKKHFGVSPSQYAKE
ncbi:MAG: response regulator [Prevotellaceae bacterium]|jgi:signal transduction histidine kinase/DNA-binding response OmpR family regulator/ligand-binding sensor domain-containing protein|nr:response regulator [Prevotellaceae bacterium]